MQVEDVPVGERHLREVAAARVQDAFGLAGRAGGVENEERVLGVEGFGLVLRLDGGELLVPPEVAALRPGDLVVAALDHEHIGDGRRVSGEGAVDGRLEREHLALAPAAVGRHDHLRARVVDARPQALRAVATEDDGVDGADAGDGEHGDDGLGDHRKVHRDPVALADPELCEQVRGPLDLGGELRVADRAAVAGLALPVQGDAVAVAGLDVSVEAVVGHVELPVGEPLGERGIRPVECLGEVRVPVQERARLVRPESDPVRGGLGIEVGGRDGGRGELLGRREAAFLVKQAVDGVAGHEGILFDRTAQKTGSAPDPISREVATTSRLPATPAGGGRWSPK